MPAEVLSDRELLEPIGSEAPRGWRGRRGQLLAVAAVAVLLVIPLDQWTQHQQFGALLTEVERAEREAAVTDERLVGAVDAWGALNVGTIRVYGLRASALADVAEVGTRGSALATADSKRVSALWISPWHGALKRAQQVYLQRLEDRVNYLGDVAADPDVVVNSEPPDTSAAARSALLAAIPTLASEDAQARIDAALPQP